MRSGIRVLSREPSRSHAGYSTRVGLKEQSILHRIQERDWSRLCFCEQLERRHVVEDVDAAAVRANDKVIRARLDLHVVHRHARNSALELSPVRAVDGEVRAELRAREQE